ncbi:MAG: hypothetical protein ABI165_18450, partial [Bryobacteraceae bacterium]
MTSSLSLLERCLWGLSTVFTIALLVQLWREKLHVVYKYFFAYLIFDSLVTLSVAPLSPHSYAYGLIYIASKPV